MKSNIKNKKAITAASSSAILGTYEGEALDCKITNNNGLDITDEVIDVVLESDEYKQGIENGWFIGFLGHPEDPNCMDFRNGCIVLKEMWHNSDGKVFARFDLVDTPVGQIVKKFTDAGVKFGISIRGAGDIVGNSVDPETFVFRGFDLVSFPAYPESIPTFTEIAASTNLADRKKYQAVCAAVKCNVSSIDDSNTIDIIQSQFAPQSEEYQLLEDRKQEILYTEDSEPDINQQKIDALTQLYLEAQKQIYDLHKQVNDLKRNEASVISSCRRKIAAMERITCSQLNDTLSELDSVTSELDNVTASNKSLKNKTTILSKTVTELKNENLIYKQKVESGKKELCKKDKVIASLTEVKRENLIYKKEIESSTDELRKKDKVIASLKAELRETVTANSKIEASTSNLGEMNKRLQTEIRACKSALQSYQDAYANMYAGALGVNPGPLSFNASTTVDELQQLVVSATNTANVPSTVTVEPVYISDDEEDDIITM